MIITLLTDFGLEDVYVGVMKGVIKTICSDVDLIDLSHNIPRQNLYAASFALQNAIDFFPSDTIHLVVVDPGVGSKRNAIVMLCEKGYFICPDNGVLTGVLSKYKPQKIYSLSNSNYWLSQNVSSTFHGRDIFASVAAHLANSIPVDSLGDRMDSEHLVKLNLPTMEMVGNTIIGAIQYIDIYGNLVTNIPAEFLQGKSWYVIDNEIQIHSNLTYSSVEKFALVALIASHGYLEIAVNGGSAKMILGKDYGDLIKVKLN